MPPQKKSEKEKVKSHWFWEFGVWVLGGILSITGIATCFIKAFTKSFAQSLADYMLELLKISFKKIWTKTIRFFKHTTPKAKVKATRLSAVSPSQEGKVAPKNVLLQSAVNVIQNAFESDERLQFSCESLQGGSCFGTVRVNNPARNCVGIVRVQIEGQSSGGHKTPITRKILIADLEKYLKNGGAVFLLARFCPKNGCVSIFYKELLPLEINALLNSEPNSNAKKRQLTLSELQPESLADVFTHFLDNARRQRPFYNEKRPVVSMQDLLDKQSSGECKILVSAPCGNNYVDLALHPEACFYVEVDSVLTPVLYHLKTVGKKINASVSVDNQEYYNEITIERKRGALVVKFGSAFSLLCTPNANASSLHCELQRTPKDFIKDVRFFIAMQKASGFKIDERVYNIKRRRGWQAQIEELAREIEYFENVVKVFKIFKLNLNIHINKLSEIERQNINILIGAFVEGKHIRFNSPYPSAGPQDLQVGLEKVKLFFTATSKRDVFRVEDFFKFNGKFERTNPVTNET
ncbi:MAG: hypothetical protein IKT27_00175, partial [Clostridia bacterium]|nr:hypothetical protein [Clostridia bacterium]